MSEALGPSNDPNKPGGTPVRSRSGLRVVARTCLYGVLAAALAAMVDVGVRASQDEAAMKRGQDRLVANHGLIEPAHKRLAPEYSDQEGRLVADPPSDPAQLLDPDVIVLAHYEGDDDDTRLVDWEQFEAQLAKATLKQVVGQKYLNTADEIAAIKAGKIQVVALHAADTPYLVNNAGFVPVAVLGTEAGAHGNHLDIAVRGGSHIRSLADLRGHKLTCTRPDSITGYRAAIAVLAQEAGMRPDVDYFTHFSHGQTRSILGLVGGEFEAAALSDDKLQSLLKSGRIEAADYRVIYESQVIPRLTIGYTHNLRPELAAKVKSAALAFRNGSGRADESNDDPMRFQPIDYKKEFEFVRRIDDSFDPRFGKTPTAGLTP